MHSLGIVHWNSTRRDHSGNPGGVSGSGPVTSSLKILYPAAFHFKEERVLAVHPPSCHPRRVFGSPENGKKMRESEAEEKETEALKASPPKSYCMK